MAVGPWESTTATELDGGAWVANGALVAVESELPHAAPPKTATRTAAARAIFPFRRPVVETLLTVDSIFKQLRQALTNPSRSSTGQS